VIFAYTEVLMDIIQVQDVTKSYGVDFSLTNVSLTVQKGKIFALLGPNGAGKTTLVKLMLNLLHSDSGHISINGFDVNDKNSRMGLAFIPEKFNFFPFYTAEGVLEFFGNMKGLVGTELKTQVKHALAELQITDLAKRKLSKMSKGQVQRVGLASILIGNNDLIVLDEPFSGLDPIGMRDLKEIIRKLKEQGKTLFINSHILLEMEQLCDEFAILNKGQLLHVGSVSAVLEQGKTLDDFFYETVNAGRPQ
jgi:ABC-2 type transport system ATP-binding protein